MDNLIHSNFIKSSNLIFGTVGLGIINMFFSSDILNNGRNIAVAVITLMLMAGLGFLVRQGKDWVKYLLLVLTIGGVLGIPVFINNIIEKPVVGIINILQTIMQVWAVVLLFKVPKTAGTTLADESSTERLSEN